MKQVKIEANVVADARYITFQLAEVAIPRWLFDTILLRIRKLGPSLPAPSWQEACLQEWNKLNGEWGGLFQFALTALPVRQGGRFPLINGPSDKACRQNCC